MILHQAAALERLLQRRRMEQPARTLVVASGKGGVGKTNLAVNLAIAWRQRQRRVLILDADLGLGNVEMLCGLEARQHLGAFLAGAADLDEVIEVGPAGIWCAAGGSALIEAPELDEEAWRRLSAALLRFDQGPQLVLIDLPAGLGRSVRASIAAARDILLVTTPEPTALADAYAVVKATATGNATARIHVVINQARGDDDGRRAFQRLERAASAFLGYRLRCAGIVPADPAVGRAVRGQRPLLLDAPWAPASVAVRRVAADLERQIVGSQSLLGFLARLGQCLGAGRTHERAFPREG